MASMRSRVRTPSAPPLAPLNAGRRRRPGLCSKNFMPRKVMLGKSQSTRPLGMDRGSVIVSDDFDAPLPPDVLAQFLGELETPQANAPKKPAVSKRRRVRLRKSRRS